MFKARLPACVILSPRHMGESASMHTGVCQFSSSVVTFLMRVCRWPRINSKIASITDCAVLYCLALRIAYPGPWNACTIRQDHHQRHHQGSVLPCLHVKDRDTNGWFVQYLEQERKSASLGCCCRLWKQAYYNANNCEALVSCAAELQGLVLANSSLAARPTLMANLLEAVTEVKEFIATFSER